MPRYQNGTLALETNAEGPVWYIRFTNPDGKRPRFRIGAKAEYPSETKASRAAQAFRDRFNAGELTPAPIYTVRMLIERYETEEMPLRYSTQRGYRKMHNCYLIPRWGTVPIADIEPLAVRAWLRELQLQKGGDASSRTKGHIHAHFNKPSQVRHAVAMDAGTGQPAQPVLLDGRDQAHSHPEGHHP